MSSRWPFAYRTTGSAPAPRSATRTPQPTPGVQLEGRRRPGALRSVVDTSDRRRHGRGMDVAAERNALVSLRLLVGVTFAVAPGFAQRQWLGAEGLPATHSVAARAMGARDVALSLGALAAHRAGGDVRPWLLAAACAEAADAVAVLAVAQHLPATVRRGRGTGPAGGNRPRARPPVTRACRWPSGQATAQRSATGCSRRSAATASGPPLRFPVAGSSRHGWWSPQQPGESGRSRRGPPATGTPLRQHDSVVITFAEVGEDGPGTTGVLEPARPRPSPGSGRDACTRRAGPRPRSRCPVAVGQPDAWRCVTTSARWDVTARGT